MLSNFQWTDTKLKDFLPKNQRTKRKLLKIGVVPSCQLLDIILVIKLFKDFESQILALFDTLSLHQFSKFKDFLCACWFFFKNLSNVGLFLENLTTLTTVVHKRPAHGKDRPALPCLSRKLRGHVQTRSLLFSGFLGLPGLKK